MQVSYVADPRQQFTLQHHPSVLSEDTLDLTVGKTGLLATVNVKTQDRTGDIILKLVEIAQNVAKAVATGEQPGSATVVYDVTFDSFDDVIASKVRGDLNGFGFSYSLHLHGNPDVDKTPAVVRIPNLPSTTQSFAAGGDSGSLVVTLPDKRMVGLLFAALDDGSGVCCPIAGVLDAFRVSLVR